MDVRTRALVVFSKLRLNFARVKIECEQGGSSRPSVDLVVSAKAEWGLEHEPFNTGRQLVESEPWIEIVECAVLIRLHKP